MTRTVAVQPRQGRSLLWLLHPGVSVRSDCGGVGTCGKCKVLVTDAQGTREVLACQYFPVHPVTVQVREWWPGKVSAETREFLRRAFRPELDPNTGLALDFGTTTVSAARLDVARHRVVQRVEWLNPQLGLGADVMSRISNRELVSSLDFTAPVRNAARLWAVSRGRTAVVTANTVMAHFLWDKDPSSLGLYPYRSSLPVGRPVSGYNRRLGRRAWMPPLLGSFVGSDCSAAIIASGMHRSRKLSLLVDAGTNGEIALGNSERMLVCSTAAGPAFEGATLECGGLARAGAICRVEAGPEGYILETVGRSRPGSICGSGVLAAVRAALEKAELLSSGRIAGSNRILLYTNPSPAKYQLSEIYLSQADIRQVQLAKAAIATGIRLLLDAWPSRPEDIARVHLTGRFGAAIDPKDAVAIGMLPDAEVVRRHPNLALLGATRAVYNREVRAEMARLPRTCTEVSLSTHKRFEDTFVQALELAPWD